ncbi:MAG: phosphoribosyltransferase, partial [Thaumarchaeota archaeon]|nr:phosphoribosyltransferase [Nitrososphaerota archaeon]
ETPVGERPPILRKLPRPSLAKPQLAPRKLRETLWTPEPSRPAPARVEGLAKAEIMPRALRVQFLENQELGELRAPVRKPLTEKPELSSKPLKSAVPEVAVHRPAVKLPPLILKPLQPRIPRAKLLKEEKVEVKVSAEEKAESEKVAEEVTRAEAHAGAAPSAASSEAEAKEVLEMEDAALPPFIRALSEVAESPGRPVVLVVPSLGGDSLVSAIAIACREIYRVVKGGKPEPRWISAASMKEEIERYLKAEDRIFVIDDREGKLLGAKESQEELKESQKELWDRLMELFSQDFGFVILHVKEEVADSVYTALKVQHPNAKVVKVEPPRGWSLEDKRRFIEACWGFVEVEGQIFGFDWMFREAEGKFFEELSRIGRNIAIRHWVELDPSAGEEHESMKVFAAECLARELGRRSESEIAEALKSGLVRTEHEFGGGRADIYVPSQQRFVEVETFYGTGNPLDKLDRVTLRKYIDRAKRVNVVILNGLLAILYARGLAKLARTYREHRGLTVNFYVPNFRERKLVPLKEILHLVH